MASTLAFINNILLEHTPAPGFKISNLVWGGGVMSEEED